MICPQRNWGFYKDCEILTFPVLFHAGTWQSVGTTVSTVSIVRPVRGCASAWGSCQGRLWPDRGHGGGSCTHTEGDLGEQHGTQTHPPGWWQSSLQKPQLP